MRQVLLGLVAAASLMAHAGGVDGTELNSRGLESYRLGHYEEAESWYRRAIEAFSPDQRLARALARENLGVALRAQNRLVEGRNLLEQALAEIRELLGADSLETAQAMSNLAAAYWPDGDISKAELLATRADVLFSGFPGSRLSERANNRQILSSVYLTQGRYQDAIKLLLASLEFGDDRMKAMSYGNLAVAAIGLGEMAQADEYARRGLALAEQALPEGHPYRAVLLNNLAQACRFSGKYLEAEKFYREALGIWETRLGPSHPDVGRGLMNLAAFYHERGREAGAEQLYLRAAAILENVDPALTLVARNELADVFRAQLRYTESEKLARTTLRQMEGTFPSGDPRMLRAWTNWAKLLTQTRRSGEAAKVMARVAKGLQ
jgi:tetratricopeptide (TPR) repeat protein